MTGQEVTLVGRIQLDGWWLVVFRYADGVRVVRARAGAVALDLELSGEEAVELARLLQDVGQPVTQQLSTIEVRPHGPVSQGVLYIQVPGRGWVVDDHSPGLLDDGPVVGLPALDEIEHHARTMLGEGS